VIYNSAQEWNKKVTTTKYSNKQTHRPLNPHMDTKLNRIKSWLSECLEHLNWRMNSPTKRRSKIHMLPAKKKSLKRSFEPKPFIWTQCRDPKLSQHTPELRPSYQQSICLNSNKEDWHRFKTISNFPNVVMQI